MGYNLEDGQESGVIASKLEVRTKSSPPNVECFPVSIFCQY
jgi:hypothetical protein